MPSIFDLYKKHRELIKDMAVIRLHGPDRQSIEKMQYLHSVGLLRGSYRPPQEVCAVRSLLRHRDGLIRTASSHILHMQKALTQMNLQIHNVISDITGVTGLSIIDAIISGERNPQKLASLKEA